MLVLINTLQIECLKYLKKRNADVMVVFPMLTDVQFFGKFSEVYFQMHHAVH